MRTHIPYSSSPCIPLADPTPRSIVRSAPDDWLVACPRSLRQPPNTPALVATCTEAFTAPEPSLITERLRRKAMLDNAAAAYTMRRRAGAGWSEEELARREPAAGCDWHLALQERSAVLDMARLCPTFEDDNSLPSSPRSASPSPRGGPPSSTAVEVVTGTHADEDQQAPTRPLLRRQPSTASRPPSVWLAELSSWQPPQQILAHGPESAAQASGNTILSLFRFSFVADVAPEPSLDALQLFSSSAPVPSAFPVTPLFRRPSADDIRQVSWPRHLPPPIPAPPPHGPPRGRPTSAPIFVRAVPTRPPIRRTTSTPALCVPKSSEALHVVTAHVQGVFLAYDAESARARISAERPLLERLRRRMSDNNPAQSIYDAIEADLLYPTSLTQRLRNVYTVYSPLINDARRASRWASEALLPQAQAAYLAAHPLPPRPVPWLAQRMRTRSIPSRCGHCLQLHAGGTYFCQASIAARAERAQARERVLSARWEKLHRDLSGLGEGRWDALGGARGVWDVEEGSAAQLDGLMGACERERIDARREVVMWEWMFVWLRRRFEEGQLRDGRTRRSSVPSLGMAQS